MRLASAALVGGPTMLVLLSLWAAARLFDGRAPARTIATFHLLALAGMAALPLVALPCLAVIRPADLEALASLNVIRRAQAAAHGLAIAYVLRIVWVAMRSSRATSRLATSTALVAAERLPTPGGLLVHLVASQRPVAYSLGGRAGDVVVSRGLLALSAEREWGGFQAGHQMVVTYSPNSMIRPRVRVGRRMRRDLPARPRVGR